MLFLLYLSCLLSLVVDAQNSSFLYFYHHNISESVNYHSTYRGVDFKRRSTEELQKVTSEEFQNMSHLFIVTDPTIVSRGDVGEQIFTLSTDSSCLGPNRCHIKCFIPLVFLEVDMNKTEPIYYDLGIRFNFNINGPCKFIQNYSQCHMRMDKNQLVINAEVNDDEEFVPSCRCDPFNPLHFYRARLGRSKEKEIPLNCVRKTYFAKSDKKLLIYGTRVTKGPGVYLNGFYFYNGFPSNATHGVPYYGLMNKGSDEDQNVEWPRLNSEMTTRKKNKKYNITKVEYEMFKLEDFLGLLKTRYFLSKYNFQEPGSYYKKMITKMDFCKFAGVCTPICQRNLTEEEEFENGMDFFYITFVKLVKKHWQRCIVYVFFWTGYIITLIWTIVVCMKKVRNSWHYVPPVYKRRY